MTRYLMYKLIIVFLQIYPSEFYASNYVSNHLGKKEWEISVNIKKTPFLTFHTHWYWLDSL